MNLKNFLFLIIFLLSSQLAYGQFSEVINSDRPDQSFNPYTVGHQILQVQAGIKYENLEFYNLEQNIVSESVYLRYGIKDRIELNTAISYSSFSQDIPDFEFSGISQANIGMRINLLKRPSGFVAGWQNTLLTTWVSEAFQQGDLGFSSVITLAHPALGGGFTFNGGFTWNGNGDGAIFNYTFNYTRPVSDRIIFFVEPYGTFFNEWNTFFNTGLGFFANPDLLFDISGGIDLNDDEEYYFIDGGISYRFLGLR